MDIKKSKLNIGVAIVFKVATMIMSIVVKRMLIRLCGNEVNGLNALYLSIIGFLSVVELGVWSAITFCMYKPIVEGDNNKISALFFLFRRLYLIIGGIIFVLGLVITPFVGFFAKGYDSTDVNLKLTFVLILISVVLTYGYGSESALINAYKNNYIVTAISQGGILFQYALQIIVLLITRSFVWYLFCRIIAVVVQWIVTAIISHKKYNVIITNKGQKINTETKKELLRSFKAMFMHKIGYVLVNMVDSMVISAFVGIIALGEYSNYMAVLTSVTGIITLVFSSLTSVIGHLCIEESATAQKYCDSFHLLNFIIGTVFYFGYFSIIDSAISILFSSELVLSKDISFVITVNAFVQFMRQSTLTFRDATGTFYNDRWKPLIEGIVNVVFSIILVKYIGVVGVILATIMTNLLICHIIEPYVLYKNAFESSPKRYFFRNYIMIFLFVISLMLLNSVMIEFSNQFLQLILNGLISVVFSAFICIFVSLIFKDISKYLLAVWRK